MSWRHQLRQHEQIFECLRQSLELAPRPQDVVLMFNKVSFLTTWLALDTLNIGLTGRYIEDDYGPLEIGWNSQPISVVHSILTIIHTKG